MKKNILFLIVFLCSCHTKEVRNNSFELIDVLGLSGKEINYESIKLVGLQTGKDLFLGDRLKIKLINNEFFVADLGSQKCVFRFDQDGRFLNRVGRVGNGPQEYNNMIDFLGDGDTINILSSNGTKSKITGYQTNGDYLYTKSIDLYATSFEKTDSNYIFYTGYNKPFHPFRIYTTDSNGKIINSYLKNETELNLPVIENNFFRLDSMVYFKEAFNNLVYQFNQDSLDAIHGLDFGEYRIPDNFYKMEMMQGFDMINKKGFANIVNYFRNKNLEVFQIVLQKGETPAHIYQIICDNNQSILYASKYDEDNLKIPFKQLISMTNNDELVYLFDPADIVKNKEVYKKLPISDWNLINGITENDNPVIAICKIRKGEK